eukprot:TRINITY_DN16511_c0_g1_i1.p1 TRINITY_DN16511_c0_g1~~TRINITY_DN16511_c0_g1_i1.p1  ORF type:complete len:368 (+),score=91.29 TRINITY_DN16511_c0_g1_i1:108-1211(+)
MKRTHSQRQEEWECCLCRGSGVGEVCGSCQAPKMARREGLLHPVSTLLEEFGREWDDEEDPKDFVVSTIPVDEKDMALTIHDAISLEEDHRVEFKECSFLATFPAHQGHRQQPQDFFVQADRWRVMQARFRLPETQKAGASKPKPRLQTALDEYVTTRLRRNQPHGIDKDREKGDLLYSDLIQELAPSFPDGRHLAKAIAPYLETIVVENVVAMLNSRKSCPGGTLYLGVEDSLGRVIGMALTHRQRRTLLYVVNRALLVIHPRLTRNDVTVRFIQVCSDAAHARPIANHCVVKITVQPKPASDVPLYIHPRIIRKDKKIVWNPYIPAAPIRKLGSVRRLTVGQIQTHLQSCEGSHGVSYDMFFPSG